MKVVCIKDFIRIGFYSHKGETYEYWTNFGGLNHIVEDHSGNRYPFEGRERLPFDEPDRDYIWDYFTTLDQWRESQIEKLI